MRIAVTGRQGQLAMALSERAPHDMAIIPCGRPDLDLTQPETVYRCLQAVAPDLVISAAAYTGVDRAESEPDLAYAVNREGAAAVAQSVAALGIPLIHISTDYVFEGTKSEPYDEDDPPLPLGVYGASKLAGERVVRATTANHAILRTAWVYSPFGRNFLKTMLRLAKDRPTLRVVCDQVGSPTSALDLADGVLAVARNLLQRPREEDLRGTFHMTGAGIASWADFAAEIVAAAGRHGGPGAAIERIASSDYPTAAHRPANSILSNAKLGRVHGVYLPDWHQSTNTVVRWLIAADTLLEEDA
ncbi:dTDP-4-dehydrorhamnose reductase [Devosia geojensis]|uniref:dTDP-4-dehydrorhamnose reductase n=1 Tax=Devosia geojensis TaxID=443610 RepID=A0A0F5FSB2_9HYPH|nr:dTDP-4-dehydrorhamnose reductase [Devosia geojensis]KKB11764.1 dTDP-4-dehydrorhamnose reductase [Devosia geojensis]